MNIEQALKETEFKLCLFKSDGDSDTCNQCDKPITKGANVYYERTCYEVDEGEYYCEACTCATPARWAEDARLWEAHNRAEHQEKRAST